MVSCINVSGKNNSVRQQRGPTRMRLAWAGTMVQKKENVMKPANRTVPTVGARKAGTIWQPHRLATLAARAALAGNADCTGGKTACTGSTG